MFMEDDIAKLFNTWYTKRSDSRPFFFSLEFAGKKIEYNNAICVFLCISYVPLREHDSTLLSTSWDIGVILIITYIEPVS